MSVPREDEAVVVDGNNRRGFGSSVVFALTNAIVMVILLNESSSRSPVLCILDQGCSIARHETQGT
jgi:hypothetical protein